MTQWLILLAVFLFIAVVFVLRWRLGEALFRDRAYLNQGGQVLLSRRMDAYLFDTLALCFLGLLAFMLWDFGLAASLENMVAAILCGLSALLFLCARLLKKTFAVYSEQGLLLSRPFRHVRFVPWNEIGSIRKRRASATFYTVFDQEGRRLTLCPLNKKTQPFFDLARQHGAQVSVPEGERMLLSASSRRGDGASGE